MAHGVGEKDGTQWVSGTSIIFFITYSQVQLGRKITFYRNMKQSTIKPEAPLWKISFLIMQEKLSTETAILELIKM